MHIIIAVFLFLMFYDGKSYNNDRYIRRKAFRCARRGFK